MEGTGSSKKRNPVQHEVCTKITLTGKNARVKPQRPERGVLARILVKRKVVEYEISNRRYIREHAASQYPRGLGRSCRNNLL